ncbi:MAG TPA: acetyl-CoA C-acyltransferase, partial [Desulfosporosinus sp.]|nr:acetyl-CoA C-acyltransferase [Desulfosporosinus sp.]
MTRAVIVSAARTPFGTMGGSLKDISAVDLGAHVIREALKRAELPGDIVNNVLMGMVIQGGAGQVPSRQASIKAGLPVEVTSETINKVCASGMRAVSLGETIIRSGDADVIIAGGMESMSNAPFALKKARFGYRMGNDSILDLMVNDGLWCAFHNVHMAVHGSTVAKEYGISRDDQDAFAFRSQQLASKAIESGKFVDEIAPLEIPQRKGESLWFAVDEGPRRDTTLAKLAALPPIFVKDGTVTAG